MKKHEAETLIAAIRSLLEPDQVGKPAGPRELGEKAIANDVARTKREATGNMGELSKPFDDQKLEDQYQAFKNRLIEDAAIDPVLLHLLVVRPEIIVAVERRIERLDGSTMRGRVCSLIAQGWINVPRSTAAIRAELARTGSDPGGGGTLNDRLGDLRVAGFLTKSADGWQKAPGIKITEETIEK